MDESTATKDTHEVHTHTELGFVSTYIFSTDHKMIAKQFLILGLLMMILGGGLALMVRWQLGYPEQPLPLIGVSQEFLETDEPQTAIDSMESVLQRRPAAEAVAVPGEPESKIRKKEDNDQVKVKVNGRSKIRRRARSGEGEWEE